MTENPVPSRVLLVDEHGPGRITVDGDAFTEYEVRMDAALADLIDRWLPFAAPNANRPKAESKR